MHISHGRSRERGVVSVLVPVFIIAAIVFILSQALIMGGNKTLDDVNQIDSVAAFNLAETGLENASSRLISSAEIDGSVSSICSAFASEAAVSLGRGSFQFETPPSSTPVCNSPSLECVSRVRGRVGNAQRVLQRTTCVRADLGDAGFGGTSSSPLSMSIKNTTGTAGVAIFNLAWRIQGSEGYSTVGNASDAFCTNCINPNPLWSLWSNKGGGTSAAGSMGAAVSVPAGGVVSIEQGISSDVGGKTTLVDRNYVQVGLVLPSAPPASVTLIGKYFQDGAVNSTSNNNASGVTVGYLPYITTNSNWCNDADTLVLGISGSVTTLGKDATFQSILFDTSLQNKLMGSESGYKARFPEPITTEAKGDLVSEIYILYNPRASLVGVSSTGNVVKVQTPVTLKAGTVLRVTSGTGRLAANTRVVSDVVNATEFAVNPAPTTAITAGNVICGGVCAYFDPASTYTQFEVRTNNSSTTGQITQWAAGVACFRGVDGSKIRPVRQAKPSFKNWREVN